MIFQFSLRRLWAIFLKEFIQMKRDRFTFGMMIGIPLMQLLLFGFAINSDPKYLPTVVVSADHSAITRDILSRMQNSKYFYFLNSNASDQIAERMIRSGEAQFAIFFPEQFTERLIRNQKPEILLEIDATDPSASAYAVSAMNAVIQQISGEFSGSLQYLKTNSPPINLIVQAKYNPERMTQYNIVPGLSGVVLTMTMVMITALAIARERERGTMEGLLAMPTRPLEVILGKLIPYVLVGYVQLSVILLMAHFAFSIPIYGSLILLLLACFPFIIANLCVGLTFSTLARNQLQAMQSSFFFFLPSILLSGFMFPFNGMPVWARVIGNALPLTHYLRIVRGIMLKGNGFLDISKDLGAIVLFFLVALLIALKRYKQTLD